MKYLSFIFYLTCYISFSQVGIGTTTPKALLDITSDTKGILIPRTALVMTTQELPVVNPNGGSLENSTMVYNTVTINDVRPGIYYWETDRWLRLSSDPQFLQFTTITLPSPSGTNDDTDFFLDTTNYTSNVFRIVHSGGEITGVNNGEHGRVIYIYNGDTNDLKLISEGSSSSSNENKFSLVGDVILKSGNSIILYYDDLYLNRWIVVRSDN